MTQERTNSLEELREALDLFVKERDWDKFHTPRNLATALSVEVAELLEHFQWMNEEEAAPLMQSDVDEIAAEMADVLMYLIRLADRLGIDLVDSSFSKLQQNRLKYPVEKARGRRTKYTKF